VGNHRFSKGRNRSVLILSLIDINVIIKKQTYIISNI
jgi:hypothetical protein